MASKDILFVVNDPKMVQDLIALGKDTIIAHTLSEKKMDPAEDYYIRHMNTVEGIRYTLLGPNVYFGHYDKRKVWEKAFYYMMLRRYETAA